MDSPEPGPKTQYRVFPCDRCQRAIYARAVQKRTKCQTCGHTNDLGNHGGQLVEGATTAFRLAQQLNQQTAPESIQTGFESGDTEPPRAKVKTQDRRVTPTGLPLAQFRSQAKGTEVVFNVICPPEPPTPGAGADLFERFIIKWRTLESVVGGGNGVPVDYLELIALECEITNECARELFSRAINAGDLCVRGGQVTSGPKSAVGLHMV
jgi:ribosomal protein L37AE/L43A